MSETERLAYALSMDELLADLARVTGERDRARDLAAALEAELAENDIRRIEVRGIRHEDPRMVTSSGWANVTEFNVGDPS